MNDQTISYPPAPWTLKGYAVQTLHLVEVDKIRSFIPAELEPVCVLPNKTMAVVYLSHYTPDSTMEYNELIVAPASVRYQDKTGSWISHIYVDNHNSLAGGREIWGLPKEIAQFSWQENQVVVEQNNRLLCSLEYQQGWFNLSTWWRQEFSGESFGVLNSDLLSFKTNFKTKIALVKGLLNIPNDSPFFSMNLGKPLITLNCHEFEAIAGIPQVVGKNALPVVSWK